MKGKVTQVHCCYDNLFAKGELLTVLQEQVSDGTL